MVFKVYGVFVVCGLWFVVRGLWFVVCGFELVMKLNTTTKDRPAQDVDRKLFKIPLTN